MISRKGIGLLLAAAVALGAAVPVFAANSTTAAQIDKNLELTQGMFEEKRTVPLWLLEDLKLCPDKTISLETTGEKSNYRVSFTGSKVYDLPELPRYDLTIKRIREEKELKKYYNAASKSTPKYLLEVAQEGDWHCEARVTMLKSSFMPGSTVHAYWYQGDNIYTPMEKNILVEEDGSFSFPVTQGGIYLITAREIREKLPGTLDFDRPARTDVEGLLTFLNEDSLYDFSDLYSERVSER